MDAFTKIVYLGLFKEEYARRSRPVFCKIEYRPRQQGNPGMCLSIVGVIAPTPSGGAHSCGQIEMGLRGQVRRFTALGKGWNFGKVHRFLAIWNEWHLNDMRAGTNAQRQALKEYSLATPNFRYDYNECLKVLESKGLQPDNGYSYGSAWLYEEVPAEVLEFLHSLPTSEREAAWV